MTFLAPSRLWLITVCVALVVAYTVLQRRRRHRAVRHPDLQLVAGVSPRFTAWRRHLTAAALLLAVTALIVGLARPAQSKDVARRQAVIMVAVDVSASMNATDVAPTRLRAAAAAAKDYVNGAPDAYRIGLVVFDARAHTLATPTTDRIPVLRALDGLSRRQLGHGSAAGEGLYTALDVMKANTARGVTRADKPYRAVVLLSDGATSGGRPLGRAAQAAAREGIPVFTIAYGTASGVVNDGGRIVPVPADPHAMAGAAATTGGINYAATSANQLRVTYDRIGTVIGHSTDQVEVTVALAGIAAALLVVAIVTSMVWSPRLV